MEDHYTDENLENIEDSELMKRFVVGEDDHLNDIDKVLNKTFSSLRATHNQEDDL